MGLGPLGIWEIIIIVGVVLLVFGPAQLPKIARGVGKAFKTGKDMKDEITGLVLDEDPPPKKRRSPESSEGAESAGAGTHGSNGEASDSSDTDASGEQTGSSDRPNEPSER